MNSFSFDLQSGKIMLVAFAVLTNLSVSAQQTEYRITDDGQYQYLSERQLAGMVYDESLGSYYKSITARTFFLETQRKGYLPDSITYKEFMQLSLSDQRSLLSLKGFNSACSSDYLSPECLEFHPEPVSVPRTSKSTVIDISAKCSDKSAVHSTNLPFTLQLILNPDDVKIENPDCREPGFGLPKTAGTDSLRMKQNQMKTVKEILGND